MDQNIEHKPWEKLREILAEQNIGELREYLDELSGGETARVFSRLNDEEQAKIFELIGPGDSADVIEQVSDAQAVDLIEDLPVEQAAAIVDALPSDQQADLLGELDKAEAQAIIEQMAPEEAIDARLLLQYPRGSAGGMMLTEYLSYSNDLRVVDVLNDLRDHGEKYSDYDVQYAYITTPDGVLVGVLRLRDILLSRRDEPVSSIMISTPFRVLVDANLEELIEFFDHQAFIGVPVTDNQGHLVGVVRRSAVMEARGDQANENYLKASGLRGKEELRNMPLFSRSFNRLSWLSINIVLNIIAASVIAVYQDTLTAAIALAVFLPIISDMSGCSGNQAVAVSIRELTLGLVRPFELMRVLLKESSVGIINGLILGILLATVAFVWKGNLYLGLVIGSAMMLNTLLSVSLGGTIPLILKRFNFDPALAASPILTTITDTCGFFFVLSFATVMLPKL